MTSSSIRLQLNDETAEIILDKPEKRNALSSDMWDAIPALVDQAVAEKAVKVIILHGGTAGAFAAGADISEFEVIYATEETAQASADTITRAVNSLANCPKPVIASIEGACVGGGVSLALATDLRIAAEGSRFAVTPARLGIVYPADDTRRLAEVVGVPNAKDILLTGRLFECEEAFHMGLINRRVPKGDALKAAYEMAEAIGAVSQWSTRAIKEMFEGVSQGWDNATPEANALFLNGFTNEDFKDGHKAFLEKRPAKFTFR